MNEQLNNEVERALKFDPTAEAERISGKEHWSQFNESEQKLSLGLHIISSDRKRELLKQTNDTYFGIPWDCFIELLLENNFKLGTEWPFTDSRGSKEVGVVYYREDGVVLFAESISGKSIINSGTCWYELESFVEDAYSLIHTGSTHFVKDGFTKLNNQLDIREGLFHELRKAAEHGKFIPIWEHPTFLWIYDYSASNAISDRTHTEWKLIVNAETNKHISECPEELRKIVACRLNK